MQYDGQWFRDRRHGNGTLTIEAAGKARIPGQTRLQSARWVDSRVNCVTDVTHSSASRCSTPTMGNGKRIHVCNNKGLLNNCVLLFLVWHLMQ